MAPKSLVLGVLASGPPGLVRETVGGTGRPASRQGRTAASGTIVPGRGLAVEEAADWLGSAAV